MKCEILVTESSGQAPAGSVELSEGKLTFTAEKGFEILMETVEESTVIVNGKKLSKEDNPKLWFETLPREFNGNYLRARLESK